MARPGRLVLQDLSRDGRTLLFTKRENGQLSELWRASIDGATERLPIALKAVRDVSLHPDGGRITFTAGMPTTEVWVIEDVLSRESRGGALR